MSTANIETEEAINALLGDLYDGPKPARFVLNLPVEHLAVRVVARLVEMLDANYFEDARDSDDPLTVARMAVLRVRSSAQAQEELRAQIDGAVAQLQGISRVLGEGV